MRKIRRRLLSVLLFACLALGALTASAEEYEPGSVVDGSVLTHELSAEGIAYPRLRGTYVNYGTGNISVTGPRSVMITGSTVARQTCDTVRVTVHLQQLKNGSWVTIASYGPVTKYNNYYVSTSRTYTVEHGYYYRMTGSHTVIENGVFESTASATDGVWV